MGIAVLGPWGTGAGLRCGASQPKVNYGGMRATMYVIVPLFIFLSHTRATMEILVQSSFAGHGLNGSLTPGPVFCTEGSLMSIAYSDERHTSRFLKYNHARLRGECSD